MAKKKNTTKKSASAKGKTHKTPARKKATSKTAAKKKTVKRTTVKKTAVKKTGAKKKSPAKGKKATSRYPKLRFLMKWCFVLGIWMSILLFLIIAYYAHDLPGADDIADVPQKSGITVLAYDDSVIGHYGGIKGNPVRAQDLPPHILNALLATEDRRFYDHPGVDYLGILRAMWRNVKAQKFVQGGSTITQQLAKNMFLTADKTIKRKIKEALLSVWLEQKLSKDEILTAYLNRVYFGAGAYGIDAAARTYFNKSAYDVTLPEGALLIGLLKAPSRYSPFSNPDLAVKRTKTVLHAMNDADYLNDEQIIRLSSGPLPIQLANSAASSPDKYFVDWVVNTIDSFVGATGRDLTVKTTLDNRLQDHAVQTVTDMFAAFEKTHHVTQTAFVAMSPDGAVRAMIGGKDYTQSRFNRATQALRQPGSAFKPFVYLAALMNGTQPWHKVEDRPITTGSYKPQNFAQKYYGTVTLETALSKSLNTATIRVMEKTGIGAVLNIARKAGLTSDLRRDMSLALGSSEVSPLELTAAYAVFANGGYALYPYAITEIQDSAGNILFQRNAPDYERLFPRGAIGKLDAMLANVVREGTGKRAALPKTRVRGKTGTSQDSRDAWFVGYTDNIVGGIWMGNDDNAPMQNVTGGNLPAQMWQDIFTTATPKTLSYKPAGRTNNNGGFGGMFDRLFGGRTGSPNIQGDNTQYFNE